MPISRFTALALLMASGLGLAACQTAKGMQSDMSQGYASVKTALQNFRPFERGEEEENPAMALASDPAGHIAESCPDVRIVGDLNQVYQFTDATNPVPEQKISFIKMSGVEAICTTANDIMTVDITLDFDGEAGPKARTKPSDRPSFAYPYFIAITNNQGSIVAKEIFAVTMAYEKTKNARSYTETIQQTIPLNDTSLKNYKVLIGFQLNEQELAYNRSIPDTPETH